jgi:formylglycine-generating enzyme required for sulfatase activity
MSAKVFISYRRDESAGHAGRIHDRLEREFGRDLLFMDVDAIPLGTDFVDKIRAEVVKCDVLLAIIGPNWIDVRDESGRRRLDNVNDFVRIEIAAALKQDTPIIPILLEGTRMPRPGELPYALRDLTLRNGLDVRHASFHADMDKLVHRLRLPSTELVQRRPPVPTLVERTNADGRIRVDAKIVNGAPDSWFTVGAGKVEWFKDHEQGPEMVLVPAGSFSMGSAPSEIAEMLMERTGHDEEEAKIYFEEHKAEFVAEAPKHVVTLSSPIAVGRFAVTFDEWEACFADGGCKERKSPLLSLGGVPAFPALSGNWPVIFVSWHEAKAYCEWLSWKTGKTYRLLSEAEREYVARASTATPFWWGSEITTAQANFHDYEKDDPNPMPVDSFEPNPWGLFNVHGNVSEWCEDFWHDSYQGAPTDGSPWIEGGDSARRVLRGGSWYSQDEFELRSASRSYGPSDGQMSFIGFRLARTLP